MYLEMNKEQLAQEFEKNLLKTNRGYNYYVDWRNVSGFDNYDVEIHALDCLIKCPDKDFYNKFKNTVTKIPSVIKVFPYLFALDKNSRKKVIKNKKLIIISDEIDSNDFDEFSFNSDLIKNNMNEEIIKKYYDFFKQMGLKDLFQNHIEKSVWDYIVGVLVGLDSNGRKNRGGTAFELACEPMIREICDKYDVTVLTQKQFKTLHKTYGIESNPNIDNRKADFILMNKNRSKVMNIEVNFYNDAGSKPDAIINAYVSLQDMLSKSNISFCLITDGECWRGTTNQLKVGFYNLNYLLNFRLAKYGMLDEIIRKEFNK